MITTVTGNSPQEINTSLFSIESNINEQAKLLNSKIKEVNDAIAKINKILKGLNKDGDVISVNGKQGIVELTASDVGALPDTTVIPSPQVPSDWNATSGVSRILNKPNLAEVATSGRYSDLRNKPKLSTVATSGKYDDLIDKPSLATVATSGNYNDLNNKPTIRTVKFVDYRWDGTMSAVHQQVPIPLSSFGSEVTPSNVLNFMVIYWTGFQAFANADWADSMGLSCALTALTTGTGYAKIRCVYFV